MKMYGMKFVAYGILIILCCGVLGCNDPGRRLTGKWVLNEYKGGLRTESESSFLTITSEDEFVRDTPGNLLGIIQYRYAVEGPYKTDRKARPSKITLKHNIWGADITNESIYKFKGVFWNRTLSLAQNYEADQDSKLRLSKDGGPVLVGQKVPDSKGIQ